MLIEFYFANCKYCKHLYIKSFNNKKLFCSGECKLTYDIMSITLTNKIKRTQKYQNLQEI